ncbi:MAG: DsrE family protein [Acidobacteria bacterium]|nr:DsrE family protein [Acidobacteriota bacterium]
MAKKVLAIFEKPIYLCMEPVDPHLFATAFGAVETPVEVDVLLRDSAVNYAVKRQALKDAKILGLDVQEFDTNPGKVVEFMMKNKAKVAVVKEDLEALGINPSDLVDGVEVMPRERTFDWVDQHDAYMVW